MNFFNSRPSWWPRAQAHGLVHGDAPAPFADEEPSIFVIALALIGALVCALTAGAFLVTLVDTDFWFRHPLSYVLSLMGLVGSGVLLTRNRGVFASCLALVLWGTFCGLFLIRLSNDVGGNDLAILLYSGVMALLQLVGASLAHAQWLKRIMGLVFGLALYVFLVRCTSEVLALYVFDVAGVLMALGWIAWLYREPQSLARVHAKPALAGWAAFVDSAAVALICMLVFGFARMGYGLGIGYDTFAAFDVGDTKESTLRAIQWAGRAWASLLVLVATGLLYSRWKKTAMATAQTLVTVLGVGVLLAVAAWFSPSLGVISLLAAGALIGGRWRIAVMCGLAALWALSMFYYSLAWPLAQKGLGLAIMGAALLAGLYLQRVLAARPAGDDGHHHAADGFSQMAAWSRVRLACLIVGALLVFGLVNWDVRGKEQVITAGQPVLVRLVPVDPRSLMQGDYMALNFSLPTEVRKALEGTFAPTARVRARLDARGEATVLGLLGEGASAGPGEIILPLKQLKGRWALVTDAYFFPEGTGKVFERAKFGDFRVLPDGRALLVGLADAEGKPIPVPRALEKSERMERELSEASEAVDASEAPAADAELPTDSAMPQASRP